MLGFQVWGLLDPARRKTRTGWARGSARVRPLNFATSGYCGKCAKWKKSLVGAKATYIFVCRNLQIELFG